MTIVEFINKYIKRGNFIIDFVKLTKPSAFNNRFAGLQTNPADKINNQLTSNDINELCDGLDKFSVEVKEASDKFRKDIAE